MVQAQVLAVTFPVLTGWGPVLSTMEGGMSLWALSSGPGHREEAAGWSRGAAVHLARSALRPSVPQAGSAHFGWQVGDVCPHHSVQSFLGVCGKPEPVFAKA